MENTTGNAVPPPAHRRQPDAKEHSLHPGPVKRPFPDGFRRLPITTIRIGAFHEERVGHAMWPELFYSGGAGRF